LPRGERSELSIIYGRESSAPPLEILLPSSGSFGSAGYSSLDSRVRSRHSSLPSRARPHVNYELNLARHTPISEGDSLVIETREYVRDIKKRRNNIHATLLRATHPGERLRRMLGYRIEQRLVKVISQRKSRTNTRKRTKKKKRRNSFVTDNKANYRKQFRLRKLFQPQKLVRQITGKLTRKRTLEKYIFDFGLAGDTPAGEEETSRSSSPRFIVDRGGAVCWPPFKIGDAGNIQSELELDQSPDLGIENFTLRKPQSDHSTDAPCVLGWLQVKSDSHVFTPALADSKEKAGPFRKAPFHSNMHVLKTKI